MADGIEFKRTIPAGLASCDTPPGTGAIEFLRTDGRGMGRVVARSRVPMQLPIRTGKAVLDLPQKQGLVSHQVMNLARSGEVPLSCLREPRALAIVWGLKQRAG
jgi:hypothetical protein